MSQSVSARWNSAQDIRNKVKTLAFTAWRTLLFLTLFILIPLKVYFSEASPRDEIFTAMQKIGDYLVGVAAIFAALTAIPEWRNRRKIAQYERCENALTTSLRFILAIRRVSSPWSEANPEDDGLPYKEKLWKERNQRYQEVANDLTRFWDVIDSANLYLTDRMISRIERLWEIWVKIKSAFETYLASGGPSAGAAASDIWERAMGIAFKNELETIENEIRSEMKRLRDLST